MALLKCKSMLVLLVLHVVRISNTLNMGVEVTINTSIERHTTRSNTNTADSRLIMKTIVIEVVTVRSDLSWSTRCVDAFHMEIVASGTTISIVCDIERACDTLGSFCKWNLKPMTRMKRMTMKSFSPKFNTSMMIYLFALNTWQSFTIHAVITNSTRNLIRTRYDHLNHVMLVSQATSSHGSNHFLPKYSKRIFSLQSTVDVDDEIAKATKENEPVYVMFASYKLITQATYMIGRLGCFNCYSTCM